MKVSIPFQVNYQTGAPVPISEIIGSLQAVQYLIKDASDNLEHLFPGLEIQKVSIDVDSISRGSLKELFVVALFITYKEDLEREVPPLIEAITGVEVSEDFNTLLIVSVLLIAFYALNTTQKLMVKRIGNSPTEKKYRSLLKDVAESTGFSEEQIDKKLEEKYGQSSRFKALIESSLRFFRPSKNQSSAPIQINQVTLPSELVGDTPSDFIYQDGQDTLKSESYNDADLEIHAQDLDRESSGWAAIPIGIYNKRLRLKLLDDVTPEQLWNANSVTGDIILVSKLKGTKFVPKEILLTNVRSAIIREARHAPHSNQSQ